MEILRLSVSITPAIFLDFDGTLAEIVDDPEQATLSPATRRVVTELVGRCPLAIVSGRDLDDVRGRVGVDGLYYVGNHGLEIREPNGSLHTMGTEALPALARAETKIRRLSADFPGLRVERKRFAIAVHIRALEGEERRAAVERAVTDEETREPTLRASRGKEVLELRPATEWDKGWAVWWILERLESDSSGLLPIYVGDDLTDEDAFRALEGRGVRMVVEGACDRDTHADYSLAGPDEVRALLALISNALGERAP